MEVRPNWIKGINFASDTVDWCDCIVFFFVGAKDSIPDNKYATIVLINVAFILRMVNAMIWSRNKKLFIPAEFRNVFAVDPELINKINRGNADKDLRGHANQKHWDIEDPSHQGSSSCLP